MFSFFKRQEQNNNVQALANGVPAWPKLRSVAGKAAQQGWAFPHLIAPAIGPDYSVGKDMMIVGQNPGPLGDRVSVSSDFDTSSSAALQWMLDRQNPSSFWRFVDRIAPDRRKIVWTNVTKLTRRMALLHKSREGFIS